MTDPHGLLEVAGLIHHSSATPELEADTDPQTRDGGALAVITGPAGVDIGPAAAYLGRDLGDGLAVRTVVSHALGNLATYHPLHGSPIPDYVPAHLHALDEHGEPVHTGIAPGRIELYNLPSAWQHPDTNLGVAYSGLAGYHLTVDLDRLDQLGMHPAHRVTVQRRDTDPTIFKPDLGNIPEPVELGDLAAHARDSVLRAGGRVLIEAGDGQTFADALHIVGIPPWASYIRQLDLYVVVDAAAVLSGSPIAAPAAGGIDPAHTAALVAAVGQEVRRNGGPVVDEAPLSMPTVIMGLDRLIPGLRGIYGRIDDDTPTIDMADRETLGSLLDVIDAQYGTWALLLGTGIDARGRHTFIDLRIT